MLNKIIHLTKETGQGLALSIIRAKSSEYAKLVDELIEEGKADIYVKSFSFLPSDEWVVPAGCYFAIKDDDTTHPGALIFIRMYLGKEDLGIGVKISDMLKNVGNMERYTKWLKDNENKLIDLTNMKEVELTSEQFQIDDDTKKWITQKTWYINNDDVKTCLIQSTKMLNDGNDKSQLDLYNELMPLYNSDKERFHKEIEDSKKKIKEIKDSIKYRKITNKWLQNQTQTDKIQTIIK